MEHPWPRAITVAFVGVSNIIAWGLVAYALAALSHLIHGGA